MSHTILNKIPPPPDSIEQCERQRTTLFIMVKHCIAAMEGRLDAAHPDVTLLRAKNLIMQINLYPHLAQTLGTVGTQKNSDTTGDK